MTTLRLVAGLAIALAGCYAQTPTPQYADPEQVSGPPGGGMDQPTYAQYEADSQSAEYSGPAPTYADPNGAPGELPDATSDASQPAEPEPSADPQDPGYTMGPVSDGEIDATLGSYGDWVEDPDYGRVWRPYATVVGVDFTPYETCGSWAWTDWGWSYNCDWDWGWLPFHYGRWNWFDGGYWGWVPGHEWGPGWVDWRHGGGYVGWRPTAPEFHDHRGQHLGPEFHDHRSGAHDSQWRFVKQEDFGHGHIHGHLYNDLAEGLRVTSPVQRPAIRGTTQPIRVASTMRARMDNPVWRQTHAPASGWRQPAPRPTWNGGIRQPAQTGWRQPPQTGWRQPPQTGWRQPSQQWQGVRQQPAWQQPRQPVTVPRQTWQQPRPQTWNQPQAGWQQQRPQTWNQPQRPQWTEPRPQTWNRPTYSPPAYHPAPSSSWSRPSSSYSAPSHSWSAPSHSSGSSSFGGSHSWGGGGGHSSGGGGHHR
jgi:uncharacterized membrane protein YgcG